MRAAKRKRRSVGDKIQVVANKVGKNILVKKEKKIKMVKEKNKKRR